MLSTAILTVAPSRVSDQRMLKIRLKYVCAPPFVKQKDDPCLVQPFILHGLFLHLPFYVFRKWKKPGELQEIHTLLIWHALSQCIPMFLGLSSLQSPQCLIPHLAAIVMCPTPSIPVSMMMGVCAPPSTRSRNQHFIPTFSEHKMDVNESDS